jgi:hypothetical protein
MRAHSKLDPNLRRRARVVILAALIPAAFLLAILAAVPGPEATPSAVPPAQTQADEYTRYELLAPETAQFRIVYDVTATAAGARY